LLGLQAEPAQRIGGAVDALGELGISIGAAVVAERHLACAPGLQVALDEVDGSVVVARNRDLRRRAIGGHGFPPRLMSRRSGRAAFDLGPLLHQEKARRQALLCRSWSGLAL